MNLDDEKLKALSLRDNAIKKLYEEYLFEKSKLVDNAPEFIKKSYRKTQIEITKTIKNGVISKGKKVYSLTHGDGYIEKNTRDLTSRKSFIVVSFNNRKEIYDIKSFVENCFLEGDGNFLYRCTGCSQKRSRNNKEACNVCENKRLHNEYIKKYGDKEKVNILYAKLIAKIESVYGRQTVCHRCGYDISSIRNKTCFLCGWIKCNCGGCGCNYTGFSAWF